MTEEKRYLSRAIKKANEAVGKGIEAADTIIDETVERSGETVKHAKNTGSELDQAGSKIAGDKIRDVKRMASRSSVMDKLIKLGAMWKVGFITEEEFSKAKRLILERH